MGTPTGVQSRSLGDAPSCARRGRCRRGGGRRPTTAGEETPATVRPRASMRVSSISTPSIRCSGHGGWSTRLCHSCPRRCAMNAHRAAQEAVELAGFAVGDLLSDAEADVCTGRSPSGPASFGSVLVKVTVRRVLGVGPAIRQAEHRAGHDHDRRSGDVEREEPNRWAPERIDHVRPHVGLDERPELRRGQAELHVAHLERDQPDPSEPLERVDTYTVRKQPLHDLRLVRPMEVRELGPVLTKESAPGPRRRRPRDLLEVIDHRVRHARCEFRRTARRGATAAREQRPETTGRPRGGQ